MIYFNDEEGVDVDETEDEEIDDFGGDDFEDW